MISNKYPPNITLSTNFTLGKCPQSRAFPSSQGPSALDGPLLVGEQPTLRQLPGHKNLQFIPPGKEVLQRERISKVLCFFKTLKKGPPKVPEREETRLLEHVGRKEPNF
jgi:hypothetical protein